MDIKDIIEIIPQVMTYLIPGYIALSIRVAYRHERKYDEKYMILMSVTISYIIRILIFALLELTNHIPVKAIKDFSVYIKSNSGAFSIFMLILAIILGYILTIYPDSYIDKKVKKLFKCNATSEESVWVEAIKKTKDTWVRVYLYDKNIGYMGIVKNYTINMNLSERELLLTSYVSFKIKQNEIIDNHVDNPAAWVLLNCKNCTNIEFIPGTNEKNVLKLDLKQRILVSIYKEYQKYIPNMSENITHSKFGVSEDIFNTTIIKLLNEELIKDLKSVNSICDFSDISNIITSQYGIGYVEKLMGIESTLSVNEKINIINSKLK